MSDFDPKTRYSANVSELRGADNSMDDAMSILQRSLAKANKQAAYVGIKDASAPDGVRVLHKSRVVAPEAAAAPAPIMLKRAAEVVSATAITPRPIDGHSPRPVVQVTEIASPVAAAARQVAPEESFPEFDLSSPEDPPLLDEPPAMGEAPEDSNAIKNTLEIKQDHTGVDDMIRRLKQPRPEVHAPQDKIRQLINNPAERTGSSTMSVKTDIIEDQIKMPDPVSFGAGLRIIPDGEDMSPLVTCSVMTNCFGPDWVNWEPETIRQEIKRHNMMPQSLTGTREEIVYDQIFALQLCYSHSGVFDFWNMFEKVAKALNGYKVNMQILQPTSPKEAVFALRTIRLLRSDLADDKLGEELTKYLAACCFQNGFLVAPGDMQDSQKFINDIAGGDDFVPLAQALWAAETKLYNMTDAEFASTLKSMSLGEDAKSIQILKNISVIDYVRSKASYADTQLRS